MPPHDVRLWWSTWRFFLQSTGRTGRNFEIEIVANSMKFLIFFTYLHLFDKNDWNKFCTNITIEFKPSFPKSIRNLIPTTKPGSPPFFQWHRYHDRPPTPLENGETFRPLRRLERGRGEGYPLTRPFQVFLCTRKQA